MKERQSLIRETSARYRAGTKKEKTKILDEFVQVTGYNRKYALHRLKNGKKETLVRLNGELIKLKAPLKKRKKREGKKIYGPEVIASLRLIWAFFWYRCGKLLAPFLRSQMAFIAEWEAFHITPEIRDKLLRISPATIDRALKEDRKKLPPGESAGRNRGIS